jgi:hypothetical protein
MQDEIFRDLRTLRAAHCPFKNLPENFDGKSCSSKGLEVGRVANSRENESM